MLQPHPSLPVDKAITHYLQKDEKQNLNIVQKGNLEHVFTVDIAITCLLEEELICYYISTKYQTVITHGVKVNSKAEIVCKSLLIEERERESWIKQM